MTQQNAEQLLQLFKELLNTTKNDEISKVTLEIQQLLNNEGALFCLLYILQQSKEYNCRMMAVIFIQQYFSDSDHDISKDYSKENIIEIKELLILIMQNESSFQIRKILCDIVSNLMKDIRPEDESISCEDIFELANQMLNDKNLFATGIYLWSLIFARLDEESKSQAIDFLLEVSKKALASDNQDSLISGMKLLQTMFDSGAFTEAADSIVELLLLVVRKAFYEGKELEESNDIIKNVSELLLNDAFELSGIRFAKFAIEVMLQDELPLGLRIKAYQLIEKSDDRGCIALLEEFNYDFEPIQQYFQLFINMMIQILQSQRDDSSFDFANIFFHNAGASFEDGKVFLYVIQASAELTNLEAIGVQIGLFLLYSIVESQQEYFSEYIDIVVKYIVEYADCEDDYILTYAFYLLIEMAEYVAPSLTTKIDIIVTFLMKHVNHQEGLRTLDIVLDHALDPPSDLSGFIQTLITISQQANSEQVVLLISCIASSISSAYQPNEDVYNLICPVLNDALEESNEEIQKVAIRCFGNLTIISPRSSAGEIEKVADMLMQVFTQGNYTTDIVLFIESIICLTKLCKNLPISFEPYFDDFAQIITTLSNEGNEAEKKEENEDEDQSDDFNRMQAQLLLCIATFIHSYPSKMAQYIERFYYNLSVCQSINKSDQLIIPICRSIKIAANEFKSVGLNCFSIYIPIITQLSRSGDIETLCEIHNTLTVLLRCCGEQLNNKPTSHVKKLICQNLSSGIGSQYYTYFMYELSPYPDVRLIRPVFKCIFQFIDTLGPEIELFLGDIVSAIKHFLKCQNQLIYGLTIEAYAKLSSVLKDTKLSTEALECIHENFESEKVEMQESITRSLRFLMNKAMEVITSNQQSFIDYTKNIMKQINAGQIDSQSLKYSSLALFCTLVVALELTPSEEDISMVLETLPPPPSDESIPSVAVFVSYVLRNPTSEEFQSKLPFIAAAVMASEESSLAEIDPQIILLMQKILSEIQKDELPKYVYYREKTLLQLIRNMPKIAEPQEQEE